MENVVGQLLYLSDHYLTTAFASFFPFNIQRMWSAQAMCANGDLPIARDACCYEPESEYPRAVSKCYHSFERTTFQTFSDRCDMCEWLWVPAQVNPECNHYSEDAWYWVNEEACNLQVKGKRLYQ